MHILADAIRRNAQGRQEAAKNLAAQLDEHAATLGLDDTDELQVTSRQLTALLNRLAATTDDTQTVRVLAAAELTKENAFYFAHLDTADRVAPALRNATWHVLEDLAATSGDVEADRIIGALRQAARRDEHAASLAAPLRKASDDAISLLRERARRREPVAPPGEPVAGVTPGTVTGPAVTAVPGSVVPSADEGTHTPPPAGDRIRAKEVAAYVMKIIESAEEHPDAEFEISWRIAKP